ncbi:hypothetical protein AAGF08_15075 [Algoriphagus sp. SE2]|uniref:hypothetical protein n=1 Tax=Algoriphagus sp. SE2 TaxID=3141536 RepID=UPI0031CDA3B8
MNRFVFFILLIIIFSQVGCSREIEEGSKDFGFDFQPLEVGDYWIYSVDQTIYFGENDSEDDSFFYRDRIFSFYINDAGEQVFIIERSKSYDKSDWSPVENYTMLIRGNSLIRTIQNQPSVVLVFPPNEGVRWDSNIYFESPEDEFEIKYFSGSPNLIQINQEEADDLVTYRDNRYEIFERGVGLIEDYEEVLTYCARNDCLGNQLIDGGTKTHMKITDYGK